MELCLKLDRGVPARRLTEVCDPQSAGDVT